MTHKLSSEMSSQKIDLSADIRFGSLTLLGGFVILDLNIRISLEVTDYIFEMQFEPHMNNTIMA